MGARLIDELSLWSRRSPMAGWAGRLDLEDKKRTKALASLTLKSVRKMGADMVWIRYSIARSRAGRAARPAKSK